VQHRTLTLSTQCDVKLSKDMGGTSELQMSVVKLIACTSLSIHEMCSLTASYNLGSTVSDIYLQPGKQYLGSKCSIKR